MVSMLISWSTNWSVKIDQSISQPVSPLVGQSICLCSAIHLTFCLFVSLSVYLSVHLSLCLSVCLSVSQSINQMAYNSNVSNLNNESSLYNTKGPGKRGHIVADTLLPTQMFPRLPTHATFVADTNFVSATNVSQFAQPKKHHGQQCVRNNVSSFTRAFSEFCSPLELASFDSRHVIQSPPIGKRIWVKGITKRFVTLPFFSGKY